MSNSKPFINKEVLAMAKAASIEVSRAVVMLTGEIQGWFFPNMEIDGVETFEPSMVVMFSDSINDPVVLTSIAESFNHGKFSDNLVMAIKNAFDNNARTVEIRPLPGGGEEWYNLAGISSRGTEMLESNCDQQYVRSLVESFDLRCRVNSHRGIKAYGWTGDHEVTFEMMDDPEYRKNIIANAKKVF